VEDVFNSKDYIANSSQDNDFSERLKWGYFCGGCLCYWMSHSEVFVPAGHVGLLMDSHNNYLFAQPGMHNIASCFTRVEGAPQSVRDIVVHGDRTIVTVEQGDIGYCMDNGIPYLLPQVCFFTSVEAFSLFIFAELLCHWVALLIFVRSLSFVLSPLCVFARECTLGRATRSLT
jgi:hypothetical protein